MRFEGEEERDRFNNFKWLVDSLVQQLLDASTDEGADGVLEAVMEAIPEGQTHADVVLALTAALNTVLRDFTPSRGGPMPGFYRGAVVHALMSALDEAESGEGEDVSHGTLDA